MVYNILYIDEKPTDIHSEANGSLSMALTAMFILIWNHASRTRTLTPTVELVSLTSYFTEFVGAYHAAESSSSSLLDVDIPGGSCIQPGALLAIWLP